MASSKKKRRKRPVPKTKVLVEKKGAALLRGERGSYMLVFLLNALYIFVFYILMLVFN